MNPSQQNFLYPLCILPTADFVAICFCYRPPALTLPKKLSLLHKLIHYLMRNTLLMQTCTQLPAS